MDFLRRAVLFLCVIGAMQKTFALAVPFQNYSLAAGAQVQVSFSFGIYNEIFCYTSSGENFGVIYWPYKGKAYSAVLPALITTSADFTGGLSDPSGVFTIANNIRNKFVVNCVFGF